MCPKLWMLFSYFSETCTQLRIKLPWLKKKKAEGLYHHQTYIIRNVGDFFKKKKCQRYEYGNIAKKKNYQCQRQIHYKSKWINLH